MSAIDRSEVRTSWAASRRNSNGYFDGLPNGDSFLQTATAAHYQVSTRPGQDHGGARRRTGSGSPGRLLGEIGGCLAQDLAFHPPRRALVAQPAQLVALRLVHRG